jgi:hypothetical protein
MTASHEPPRVRVLRRCWQQWVEVVALFAQRRRTRHRLRDGEYQSLHGRLIRVCRSLARAAEGTQRAYYQKLEALARPWLTTRVMEQTDQKILLNLLARCRQVGRELGGWDRGVIARRSMLLGLATAAGAGLGLALMNAGGLARLAAELLQDVRLQLHWATRQATAIELWMASGAVLVLIALFVVWRARG